MKLLQFKGPFHSGQTVSAPAHFDNEYVHIGVQIPHSQHIGYVKDRGVGPDFYINNIPFAMNGNSILEFDMISETDINVFFTHAIDADAIIDIVYRVLDE